MIIVSDFSLLEFFSEQDQRPTLIAGKPTPSEVFGAQRRWLQACRGLLVLTRVSSKTFEAVTEEKPWRLDAIKLLGTSVFQHIAPSSVQQKAVTNWTVQENTDVISQHVTSPWADSGGEASIFFKTNNNNFVPLMRHSSCLNNHSSSLDNTLFFPSFSSRVLHRKI